jgi:L-alanine-DL-glutamate epimerase-like enolase superfamily enzyme
MKVKDIRASVHTTSIDVPLLTEKVSGYGREEQREFVFCEVETDEGVTGVSLTGHFLTRSVVAALEHHFLPVVRDMDPREVEAVHQRVWRKLNPRRAPRRREPGFRCFRVCRRWLLRAGQGAG